MLEDFNIVLNHLLKFYRVNHSVFVSLDRIKKVIKEHAQQSTNKQSMPLMLSDGKCIMCGTVMDSEAPIAGRDY